MILETFESYNDISILGKRIIEFLSKEINNEKNILEQIVGEYKINDVVKVNDLKSLENLFENNHIILTIRITHDDMVSGRAEMQGNRYYIDINLNSKSHHAINKYPSNSIHFLIRDVFLHEFQHIFDFYRSNGKSGDKASYDVDKLLDSDLGEYKKYIRDDMEVSAKMVEVLSSIGFFTFGDDFNLVPRELREVLEEFKKRFRGFDLLKEKQKKSLLSKISQYYHKKIDKYKDEK